MISNMNISLTGYANIYNFLKDVPGLEVPLDTTHDDGGFVRFPNPELAMLGHEDLYKFLCLGSPDDGWWSQSHAQGRICRILEITQDRAQKVLDDYRSGYSSIEPLSTFHWRDVRWQLFYKEKDECRLENVLEPFARFLFMTRRHWMMKNRSKWCDAPNNILVARIHSCLMTLKRMHLQGLSTVQTRLKPLDLPVVLKDDRWLDFDVTELDIDCAVKACERHFPRSVRGSNNGDVKREQGLDSDDDTIDVDSDD